MKRKKNFQFILGMLWDTRFIDFLESSSARLADVMTENILNQARKSLALPLKKSGKYIYLFRVLISFKTQFE